MAKRATAKLTKRAADALRPGDPPLWCPVVPSFELFANKDGSKSFRLYYRVGAGGRAAVKRKKTIGHYGAPWTIETARARAKAILRQVEDGGDPAAEEAKARRIAKAVAAGESAPDSVAVHIEEWLRRDQAGNRTVEEVRATMARDVLPRWGARPTASIRKRDVIELVDAMVDRGAPVRANRVLAFVKRFFRWAAARDLIDSSPAQHVERPTPERARDRVLSDVEVLEIWRALDHSVEPYRAAVRLLLLTGARRDEIFGARRSEIDRAGAALVLPATRAKSGEGRRIHLSRQALAVIDELPVIGEAGWLITLSGARALSHHSTAKVALDAAIAAARAEAGIVAPMPPWRIHDLRRTVATGLQRLGVRLEVIEAVLGHISGSRAGVVGTYQRHSFQLEAATALDAWGDHVGRLLDPSPARVVPLRQRAGR